MSEKLSERMLDMLDMNMTLSERSWINRITRYADEVAQLEAELAAEIDIRNQYIAERDRLAEEIGRLRELLGGDARHYVDCYHLQFPDAGAGFVVQEIDALLEGKDGE